MKRMVSGLLALLLCLCWTGSALADLEYIFPDSDTRRLTWDEVAEWDYESLGYAFNEIFARYGYVFNPGQKFEYYFNTKKWYRPNANPDNENCVYPYVTTVEWDNYRLIKEVRAYKRAYNDYSGKSIWDNFSTGFDSLQGFEYASLRPNQLLSVYSAPSAFSWRGANGKAQVSTNGRVDVGGWENGWLLVMYETNSGSVRVGYVDGGSLRGEVQVNGQYFGNQLNFSYTNATVTQRCTLTDDPARTGSSITTLNRGATVTYLSTFYNRYAWDYVETRVGGQVARGFIRSGSLNIDLVEEDTENLEGWK